MKKYRMLGAAMMVTLLFASCSNKKEATAEPATQPASSTTQEVSNSGSENWDEVIKSYGEFTDKYIALVKKASSGDASAVQEYTEALQKAQEMDDKLSKAKNSLTPDQIKKLTEIEMKMAKAATDAIPK